MIGFWLLFATLGFIIIQKGIAYVLKRWWIFFYMFLRNVGFLTLEDCNTTLMCCLYNIVFHRNTQNIIQAMPKTFMRGEIMNVICRYTILGWDDGIKYIKWIAQSKTITLYMVSRIYINDSTSFLPYLNIYISYKSILNN